MENLVIKENTYKSPFSRKYDWSIEWFKQNKPISRNPYAERATNKELELLNALMSVDVIGLGQAFKLFGIDRRKAGQMCKENKLVRHYIYLNGKPQVIYTLGREGQKLLGLEPAYKDYWLEYSVEDILKRLTFYQFYRCLPKTTFTAAPQPFTANIINSDKHFNVYVVKDNTRDIERLLTYNEYYSGRVFMILESFDEVLPLMEIIVRSQVKIRFVLEHDIAYALAEQKSIFNLFYYYDAEKRDFKIE